MSLRQSERIEPGVHSGGIWIEPVEPGRRCRASRGGSVMTEEPESNMSSIIGKLRLYGKSGDKRTKGAFIARAPRR